MLFGQRPDGGPQPDGGGRADSFPGWLDRQLDLVRVGIDFQSFSQVVNACLLPTGGISSPKFEQCMLTIENCIFIEFRKQVSARDLTAVCDEFLLVLRL